MATLFAASTSSEGNKGSGREGSLGQQQYPATAVPDLATSNVNPSSNNARECPLLDNSHTSTSPTDPSPSVATESLPSTYATLPRTTKLDEEPNPFEQSFSSGIDKEDNRTLGNNSNSNSNRRILPPLAAIDSPTRGVISRKDEIIWDSLRSGPLSPSMLTGPAEDKRSRDHHSSYHQRSGSMMKYEVIPSTSSAIVDRAQMVSSTSMYNYPASTSPASAIVAPSSAQAPGRETTGQVAPSSNDEFPPPPPSSSFVKRKYPTSAHVTPPQPQPSTTTAEIIHEHPSIKRRAQTKYVDDEEKRKNFLERNRQAAFKCRQRKKQWVQDLQSSAEYLTATNEQLKMETARLREEIFHLKSLLQEHMSCPLNPQAVLEAINRPIPHSDTITQYPPTSTESSPSTAIQRI
ncbi:hypothetical protein RO3G_05746 [Lichtheimia corymbifera JMRC:FSU:9682]|uniref:BZIP domain-containing protein n=1 Tax=Lichtheimia corymbifera JMRC:FSU:9682 TaxID=1263082 RepID=A0A068RQY2_9FUNG|nr:hypothetical protein RO3G_05746 [Lichtheimia corymbifera JMRC:FSU:9682]